MQIRPLIPLLLILLLGGCRSLQGTPQPAPPVAAQPQEIQRNQTLGLLKTGTISVWERGSPDDSLRALKAKAAAAKANYYLVLLNDETITPGIWHGQAILYRQQP